MNKTTQTPAYTKGSKINYFGKPGIVTKVTFCIYQEEFYYNIKYTEQGVRFSATTYESHL